MAILLLVLGPLLGLGTRLLYQSRNHNAFTATQTHQNQIIQALSVYISQHATLPCPAHPLASPESFGLAQKHCGPKNGAGGQGMVPFRTLGIPEKIAKDGWGFWMTYAIEYRLNEGPHVSTIRLVDGNTGLRTGFGYCDQSLEDAVKNAETITVLKNGISVFQAEKPAFPQKDPARDVIAAVIVSHGPSGGGSLCKKKDLKDRLPFEEKPSLCQQMNADGSMTFCDSETTPLVWKTRFSLGAMAGLQCANKFLEAPQLAKGFGEEEGALASRTLQPEQGKGDSRQKPVMQVRATPPSLPSSGRILLRPK